LHEIPEEKKHYHPLEMQPIPGFCVYKDKESKAMVIVKVILGILGLVFGIVVGAVGLAFGGVALALGIALAVLVGIFVGIPLAVLGLVF
jgi:hypothetical protein